MNTVDIPNPPVKHPLQAIDEALTVLFQRVHILEQKVDEVSKSSQEAKIAVLEEKLQAQAKFLATLQSKLY